MLHQGVQVLRGSFKTGAFPAPCKQYPRSLVPGCLLVSTYLVWSLHSSPFPQHRCLPVLGRESFNGLSGGEEPVRGSEWLILTRTDRSSPVTSWTDKATWIIVSLLHACGSNADSGITLDYVLHQKSLDVGFGNQPVPWSVSFLQPPSFHLPYKHLQIILLQIPHLNSSLLGCQRELWLTPKPLM